MLILIPYVSPKYRFGHTEKGNRDSSTFLESYLSRGNTAQTKGDFPGLWFLHRGGEIKWVSTQLCQLCKMLPKMPTSLSPLKVLNCEPCLSFSLKSNCTFKPSTQSLFLLDFLTSELQILVLLVVHKDAADHMSLLVHLAWKKLSLSLDETWTMVSLKAGTAEKLAEPLVTAFPGRMSLHHHLSGHLSVFHHHSTNPIQ